MSELIQMRQRIKAIETIKKITHAMRLISMSAHSRLKMKHDTINLYKKSLSALFYKVSLSAPQWHNTVAQPPAKSPAALLVILIGSQKGLCGNFNTALFSRFQHIINEHTNYSINIIAIGKKATDYCENNYGPLVIQTHNQFSARSLFTTTQSIVHTIMHHYPAYTKVIIVHNVLHNFFHQKPYVTPLIPFDRNTGIENQAIEEYTWEQDPEDILNCLLDQYLHIQIQYALFQSLLAEHAARFISMDNATRNAEQLLDHSKLMYNKLRQTKITKELTELSSSF